MKVTTTKGKVLDTEKLGDLESIFIEKVDELLQLSKTYNIPFFCMTDINNKGIGVFNYIDAENFYSILENTDKSFSESTDGAVRVVCVDKEFGPDEDEDD